MLTTGRFRPLHLRLAEEIRWFQPLPISMDTDTDTDSRIFAGDLTFSETINRTESLLNYRRFRSILGDEVLSRAALLIQQCLHSYLANGRFISNAFGHLGQPDSWRAGGKSLSRSAIVTYHLVVASQTRFACFSLLMQGLRRLSGVEVIAMKANNSFELTPPCGST